MAKTRSNTAPKKKAPAKAKEKTPAKAAKDRGKESATTFKIKSSASAAMDDHHFDRKSKSKGGDARGLMSKKEQEVLQSLAIVRDNKSDGMGRKEMCQAVAQLKGVSLEKGTNHYNYLIRSGNLKRLKRGGRVVKAQATTTNRTAVTTAKLLRTYMVPEAEGTRGSRSAFVRLQGGC